ncbi:MAG: TetR/AcrR family transcriptional regulator [Limnohabitans sp.]
MYKKPLQARSIASEERFLDVLDLLLKEKSFGQLTIDEIAEHAFLTRGAFLKRFGSKKQALFVLWARYCERSIALKNRLIDNLGNYASALDACTDISKEIEAIQIIDFSANRAMHEDFHETLQVNAVTKRIFLEGVDLVHRVRQRFMHAGANRDGRDYAAAQLFISLNFNYVLNAMPGLPADPDQRHRLIGRLVVEAMKE